MPQNIFPPIRIKQVYFLCLRRRMRMPQNFNRTTAFLRLKLNRVSFENNTSRISISRHPVKPSFPFKQINPISLELIGHELNGHVHTAYQKLRRWNGFCGAIEVMLKTKDFTYSAIETKFTTATNSDFDIREAAQKLLSIVYRNRFIIENTDFIIAYNKYHGRVYKFCCQAQHKGVIVIELS